MQSAQVIGSYPPAIDLAALKAFVGDSANTQGECDEAWKLAMIANAGLVAQRRLNELLQRAGYDSMPAGSITALAQLRDAEPRGLTTKLLYSACGTTNLHHDINKLRVRGLVDCVVCPKSIPDRRNRWLRISAAGLEFLEMIGA